MSSWFFLSLMRGLAFFLGIYIMMSSIDLLTTGAYNPNSWWVDLSLFPEPVRLVLEILLAISLLLFAARPPRKAAWRAIGTGICILFAAFAINNTVSVYFLAAEGTIDLGFPLPFSLGIALLLIALGFAQFYGSLTLPEKGSYYPVATVITALLAIALSGVLFPIGQAFCFGTTDYRAPVDAVVIFGAKANPNGTPSPALAGRVDKGIELYNAGYTPVLIMSGGTGVEGVDEAQVMKDYAIQRGVPESAIILDSAGNSSEDTVQNTLRIADEHGFVTIGAVSSFYHMARIKMLFLAEGKDVVTSPAATEKEGPAAVALVREIPGWWYYFYKNVIT
jgi:vancomycin permeability regulator SanA